MYEHKEFPKVYITDHPLIQSKLSKMRDKHTSKEEFKDNLHEISLLMGYEITRNLEIVHTRIETPIEAMDAPVLKYEPPVIVPILRAGLGMSEGLFELMPTSRIGHIGLYRDHETHRPVEYLVKLPPAEDRRFILVDPMLATGHSARYAVDVLVKHGVKIENITFMALVGAPEGVKAFREGHKDVPIYIASLDPRLNENAYIVPGLGDAGDRLFGT